MYCLICMYIIIHIVRLYCCHLVAKVYTMLLLYSGVDGVS